MYRKHLIMRKNDEEPPFYAWQCLTLQVASMTGQCREIDLVIPCDVEMMNLLKVLVTEMKTIDGNRGTAVPLVKEIIREREQQ